MEKCDIVITEGKLTQLNSMRNKLLLWNDRIVFFSDFQTEVRQVEVTKGIFKKRKEKIEELVLTGIDLIAWHTKGKFWAIYTGSIIERFINYYNIYELRENYVLGIKEPLQNLGVNMDLPRITDNSLLDLIRRKSKENNNDKLDQ